MNNLSHFTMEFTEKNALFAAEEPIDEDNLCEICAGELPEKGGVILSCKHKFHYQCVVDWYIMCEQMCKQKSQSEYTRRTCPYCKSEGGYLDKPENVAYIKGIHKSTYYKRDKKMELGVDVKTGMCPAIAKSTGSNCRNKGQKKYNGYCYSHRNYTPCEE